MRDVALIILDGWGINHNAQQSAIEAARTPYIDELTNVFPSSTLVTYGEDVGLPEGQMGNSEVGHTNIGAGRVVYQELVRINKAIREKTIEDMSEFKNMLSYACQNNKNIHLLGLVSDGGVHSHIDHLIGLCDIFKQDKDLPNIYIHAFTDGRDTDPKAGVTYIDTIQQNIKGSKIQLATIIGRYYAMDRDKRWERVKIAYEALVEGIGSPSQDPIAALQKAYDEGQTDEFIQPIIVNQEGLIKEGDVCFVFCYNFRTDRPRQLTEVLCQRDMHEYNMHKLSLYYVTFTNYDASFENIHVIFQKENLQNTLGEIISKNNLTQVRIAETEKYPHVTFFFNGGLEDSFEGEKRILVPSPKVATYDLQPEMSAEEITQRLIDHVNNEKPNFICLNYANTDMVGHTGDFEAAVQATEYVDHCVGRLLKTLFNHNYICIIIADHGNSDLMVNQDGSPNTAHTTNPVPIIICGNGITKNNMTITPGKLGDIAPTILHLMGLDIPTDMNGNILIASKS